MQEANNVADAVQRGRGSLWMVWLIPLVALIMAGWMVFKHYRDAGTDIVIIFDNGNGIQAGKTPLMYNGIRVGAVSRVRVDPSDMTKIEVTVAVQSDAADAVAREGTRFVKIEPRVSVTEVKGLDTIISGVYIDTYTAAQTLEAIRAKSHRYRFEALTEQPSRRHTDGRYVVLRSEEATLKIGAPVLYRHFVVGEVVEQNLSRGSVETLIYIKPAYAPLVKEQSRFWKLSGVDLKATLAGVKFRFDSLATLVAGGVVFDSPDASPALKTAYARRTLYESESDSVYDERTITLQARRAYAIDPEFASVRYRGIRVGRVADIAFQPEAGTTRLEIRLEKRFRHLANAEAAFWVVQPQIDLRGVSGLDAIVNGPYIAFDTTDTEAAIADTFVLRETPPEPAGVKITLAPKFAGSLKVGTTLFYRDVAVGRTTVTTLEGHAVKMQAVIAPQFAGLLNDTSRFYLKSGLQIDAGFDGIHLQSGALEHLVAGGITFETFDQNASRTRHDFTLFENRDAMRRSRYLETGGMRVTLALPFETQIRAGSPVTFGPFSAGEVAGLHDSGGTIDAELIIDKAFVPRINRSSRFEALEGIEMEADLSGVTLKTGTLEQMVRGGVRVSTPDPKAQALRAGMRFTLFDGKHEQTVPVTLLMPRGFGLHAGSPLEYRDLQIGQITGVTMNAAGVEATLAVKAEYRDLLRRDSWLWLESFGIDAAGVHNARAAVTGPTLQLLPGSETQTADRFVLALDAPPPTFGKAGLRVVLEAGRSSLSVGSELHYRQIPIGQVESYRLADDGSYVDVVCFIAPQYAHLVRTNTRFYNASAIGMEVNLGGLKVKTESLDTMLRGGIGMAVPEPPGLEVRDRHRFILHDEAQEEWLQWRPKL